MDNQKLIKIIQDLLDNNHEHTDACSYYESWKLEESVCNCGADKFRKEVEDAIKSPLEKVL